MSNSRSDVPKGTTWEAVVTVILHVAPIRVKYMGDASSSPYKVKRICTIPNQFPRFLAFLFGPGVAARGTDMATCCC